MEQEPHGGPSSVGSSFLGASGSGMRGPQSPRDPGLKFAAPSTPPSNSNPHTPASPHPAIGQHGQQHPNFSSMTSPPTHMPHPSPGTGLMPNSPLNPQQSPMPHSPGPMGYIQGKFYQNSQLKLELFFYYINFFTFKDTLIVHLLLQVGQGLQTCPDLRLAQDNLQIISLKCQLLIIREFFLLDLGLAQFQHY